MKILLADDSMTAQNMGKKILTDAGFEVIAVSNGAAALKKITSENPDIIILDVFMPGYTGLEVCERLKNNPETSRKPVLLTVGKMEPFNPDDSNRVRAEGVMIKPFEATDLTAAVEAIAKRFNIPKTSAPPPPPPVPKAPQNYRSYEETVMLSQDELRQSLGIADDGANTTEAATAAAVASPAAVAVAMPALELDSSAIVTEQEESKPAQTAVPVVELETPPTTEPELHSPFSHASVAREVVEHPAAPVQASEAAAWEPGPRRHCHSLECNFARAGRGSSSRRSAADVWTGVRSSRIRRTGNACRRGRRSGSGTHGILFAGAIARGRS